ncbi:hypothetical protein P7H06_19485 [Paenibacillus larvae]|nr:hypothetical protein [Paenibacillus larvae]MDT2261238.1 hypothetical protein [Paenibacillus larvae]
MMFLIHRCTHGFVNINLAVKLSRQSHGRNKPAEELDDHERLKLRIKELEARNEYLEMENALAKKLAEIRRRHTR